jgi:thiamine-phosphate pyrophosphorylase
LRPHAPSLYLITDRKLTPGGIGQACQQALAAAHNLGVRIAVQLREKDLSGGELYRLGRELRDVTARYGAMLLVNGRVDVALAVDADGVHLPANSFRVGDARALLGSGKLIGVSTHSVDELKTAERDGADFAVFGPVLAPLSKSDYAPPMGIAGLRDACASVSIPVLALGGVTAEAIPEIRASGASGVALIGAVFGDPSPADAMRRICDRLR